MTHEKPGSSSQYWARSAAGLSGSDPAQVGATGAAVDGKLVVGPQLGFGQLWHKVYQVRLSGQSADPAEVVRYWKEHFAELWPRRNRFYPTPEGIQPGSTPRLALSLGGPVPVLRTKVLVVYADPYSFSFMSPRGHVMAGMITFSAQAEEGTTLAQIELFTRAADPFFELGMRLFGRTEDQFWEEALENLARRYGVRGQVQTRFTCLDPAVQWRYAGNLWHNGLIRGMLGAPLRLVRQITGGKEPKQSA